MAFKNRPDIWEIRRDRFERLVYSEDDLRRAIAEVVREYDSNSNVSRIQTRIVIAQPITITDTITLPESAPGLVVESLRGCPISPAGGVGTIFKILGYRQELRDLLIWSPSETADLFVKISASRANITGCHIFSAARGVELVSGGGFHTIRECIFESGDSSNPAVYAQDDSVLITGCDLRYASVSGNGARLIGNNFDGPADSFVLALTGSQATVIGNNFNDRKINAQYLNGGTVIGNLNIGMGSLFSGSVIRAVDATLQKVHPLNT